VRKNISETNLNLILSPNTGGTVKKRKKEKKKDFIFYTLSWHDT